MATRLHYALPIARQLAVDSIARARPGGLAARLAKLPSDSPFVIIAGPGRSGTSAVARVLHESGISMGSEFDEPTDQNAAGFYEDVPMRELNKRIVSDLGLATMRSAPGWPWRSAVFAVAKRYEDEMRELASKAEDGWKDPQFGVTLEPWLRYLPRRPKIVLCLRSPEAYLHSVTHIHGLVSREWVERRWADDFGRLLGIIRDYKLDAFCMEYDELVAHPQDAVPRLAAFIGHPLEAGLIEPDLRRFVYAVPAASQALYDAVRAIGGALASPSEQAAGAIDSYLERVREIEAAVEAAKEAWTGQLGTPPVRLDGDQDAALLREASLAYNESLREAQAALGALEPPANFRDYHDLLRESVDGQRLVAQLIVNATGESDTPHTLDDAARVWQEFASPEVEAKAREQRAEAYERALVATARDG